MLSPLAHMTSCTPSPWSQPAGPAPTLAALTLSLDRDDASVPHNAVSECLFLDTSITQLYLKLIVTTVMCTFNESCQYDMA